MQEINAKQEKIQKNPPSKTKEVTTDLRETVSIACKLNSVSVCPMLSQTKLRVGRREWQLAILLRLYLCKALFHMPTHLLLGSWQRSVAEGTYLPFVLLPPFHFSNPSCMDKARKEKKKGKRKTCQVCRSIHSLHRNLLWPQKATAVPRRPQTNYVRQPLSGVSPACPKWFLPKLSQADLSSR